MGDEMDFLDHLCLPAYSTLDNSYHQNPCEIAHLLFEVCDSPEITRDDYDLYPLDPDKGQHRYPPPNQWQATECICSMAGYNLVQACALCQQPTRENATTWTDWVSNCTMSNINGGKTFPYNIPDSTTLPNWAYSDNAHGAFDIGDAFRRINSNSSFWPFNPSSYSIATASSTRASSASSTDIPFGKNNQGAEPTGVSSRTGDGDGDADDNSHVPTRVILCIVIPVVVVGALLAAALAYTRRKKRNARARGLRLGSDSDLPAPPFGVDGSVDPFADAAHIPVMTQTHKDPGVASLFMPSETVFSRPSRSRSRMSFTTNSISTAAESYRPSSRQTRLDPEPYGQGSLFAPSTADYDRRSSVAYTYDEDEDEDESISPFSDIYRPPPTRVASRNNIHARLDPSGRTATRYSYATSGAGSETDSITSSRLDPDAESLITLSSRVSRLSRLSRCAPSSSGATYGGVRDSDEELDSDEDLEEEEGYETEQGRGRDSCTDTETEPEEIDLEADSISLTSFSTTTSNHEP
ncbi:uncharacterized protein JCM15063_001693 [Sporobolomyces koalae]|uniref:uncharacterized protein n=1 Tax=Sporobolomyces koalae TaxID=500713 RepID=UPI00316F68F9